MRGRVGASNPGTGKRFWPINHRKARCGLCFRVDFGHAPDDRGQEPWTGTEAAGQRMECSLVNYEYVVDSLPYVKFSYSE